ncbi:MAG: DUF4389 domain-containing protein [Candidatus Hydrothermarchaeaceae archaeon]
MVEYPIKLDVEYDEKASRLEALIIRPLYGIVLYIILEIWGLIALVVVVLQWFHILILGKRHQGMHNFVTKFFRYLTRVYGYFLLLTDARPPISGE